MDAARSLPAIGPRRVIIREGTAGGRGQEPLVTENWARNGSLLPPVQQNLLGTSHANPIGRHLIVLIHALQGESMVTTALRACAHLPKQCT